MTRVHFVVVIFPKVEPLVDELRRRYDPTVDVIATHLPVVFPVPASVGRDKLAAHIAAVAAEVQPFDLRLTGLRQSRDHWLFLTPTQGEDDVRRLYGALHTGVLAAFRVLDDGWTPHVGLGHFMRAGARYDWEHPRVEDFEAERFETALREAEPLRRSPAVRADALHLVAVPDELLEWSAGERPRVPTGARTETLASFGLGGVELAHEAGAAGASLPDDRSREGGVTDATG